MIILLILLVLIAGVIIGGAYYLFEYGFDMTVRGHRSVEEIAAPGDGSIYTGVSDEMVRVAKEMEKEPWEEFSMYSRDGLKLYGYGLLVNEKAPWVLFVHGYTGTWKLDGYGTYKLCKEKGYNMFVFDQRAHGKSEGKVTTFGIKEQFDCIDWINFIREKYGKDITLIISGVSMGSATVQMAASKATGHLVQGVIADCGFSSGLDIFANECKKLKLPEWLGVRLGVLAGKLFGKVDVSKESVKECVKSLDMPIVYIHGTKDTVVPFEMLDVLYNACGSPYKNKVVMEGCDHAVNPAFDYGKWKAGVEEMLGHVRGL